MRELNFLSKVLRSLKIFRRRRRRKKLYFTLTELNLNYFYFFALSISSKCVIILTSFENAMNNFNFICCNTKMKAKYCDFVNACHNNNNNNHKIRGFTSFDSFIGQNNSEREKKSVGNLISMKCLKLKPKYIKSKWKLFN